VLKAETRKELATICWALVGLLFGAALWTYWNEWLLALGLAGAAVIFGAIALVIEPAKTERAPRGGPVIEPNHTIVSTKPEAKGGGEA
jgi:hypothetical protein